MPQTNRKQIWLHTRYDVVMLSVPACFFTGHDLGNRIVEDTIG